MGRPRSLLLGLEWAADPSSGPGIGSSGVKSGDSRTIKGMGNSSMMILDTMPCGKWSKLPPTKPQISQRVTPKYFPQSCPWLMLTSLAKAQVSDLGNLLDGTPVLKHG